jgi:hypothetical protein
LLRNRAADTGGSAKHHSLHPWSPNNRRDWALRSRRAGSHFARSSRNRGSRGSIARKCSGRVNLS